MYLGSAIGMIALGAILAFAVEFDIAGININMVGFILMVVGVIGAVLSLTVWGNATTTGRREVVRERDVY
jgi:heme/copper-type cytochrome/quinol oxidase subunit 1